MSSEADTSTIGQTQSAESTNLKEKLAGTVWGKGASKHIAEAAAASSTSSADNTSAEDEDKETTTSTPAVNPISSNWRNALMANYQGAAANTPPTSQRRFQSDGDHTSTHAPRYRGNRREHHSSHNRNEENPSAGRFQYLRSDHTSRQGGHAQPGPSTHHGHERTHVRKGHYHSGAHSHTTREFKPRTTDAGGVPERTRAQPVNVPPVVPFPPPTSPPSPNFSGKEGSSEPDGVVRFSRDFLLSLFRPSLQPSEEFFVEVEGVTTIDSLAPATITWEKANPVPQNLITKDIEVTPALSRAYAFGEIYNSWEREMQRDHVRRGPKAFGKELPPGLSRHAHPYHRQHASHTAGPNYEGSDRPTYDSAGHRPGSVTAPPAGATSAAPSGSAPGSASNHPADDPVGADATQKVHASAPATSSVQSSDTNREQVTSTAAASKDSVAQQDSSQAEGDVKSSDSQAYDTEIEAWYYKDSSGDIQGPFSGKRMWDWYQLGYFGKWPHLPVSYGSKDNFVPMSALFTNPTTAFLTAPPAGAFRKDEQQKFAQVTANAQSFPHPAGQMQRDTDNQYPNAGNMRMPNYGRDMNIPGPSGPAGFDAASGVHPNERAQWVNNARGFLDKLVADHMHIRREKDEATHAFSELQSHYNLLCGRINEMEKTMKNLSNQMMHMGPNAHAAQHMEDIKRQYSDTQNERYAVQSEMMHRDKVLTSRMHALESLDKEISKVQRQLSEVEKRPGRNDGPPPEYQSDTYGYNTKGHPMQNMMNMFQHMSMSGPNPNEPGAMHGMDRGVVNTGMWPVGGDADAMNTSMERGMPKQYPHPRPEMISRPAPWHPSHPRPN